MRVERSGVALVLAVALLAAGCTGSSDGLVLKLNLAAGQSFPLKMVADQKIIQDMQGQKMEVTQVIGMGYTFAVESVDDDGNAWVKTTYDWVSMKQDMGGMKLEYDSADPPKEVFPGHAGLAALLGKTVRLQMDPRGAILKVEGLDALLQGMFEDGEIPEGPLLEQVKKQMKDQFGDEAMKESMRNLVVSFPEKPVEVGDSWTQKAVVSKGFPMIVESTYTLKEYSEAEAIIGVASTLKPNPDAPPMEMGPSRMRTDLSGTQEGTMVIGLPSGMTRSAEFTQKLEGRIAVETEEGEESEGWPMTVDSTVTIGPLEKK